MMVIPATMSNVSFMIASQSAPSSYNQYADLPSEFSVGVWFKLGSGSPISKIQFQFAHNLHLNVNVTLPSGVNYNSNFNYLRIFRNCEKKITLYLNHIQFASFTAQADLQNIKFVA